MSARAALSSLGGSRAEKGRNSGKGVVLTPPFSRKAEHGLTFDRVQTSEPSR
jgi:hypothetical protein